jgi:hypothetical protein
LHSCVDAREREREDEEDRVSKNKEEKKMNKKGINAKRLLSLFLWSRRRKS